MVTQIEGEKTPISNGRELLGCLLALLKQKMKPPIISSHPQESSPPPLKEIGVTARVRESAPLNLETEIDNFEHIIYKCCEIIIDAIPTDSNIQEDTYFITLYSSSSAKRATKELADLTGISNQLNPFRKRPAIFAVTILWNIANGLKAEVFAQPIFDLPDHMISFINNQNIMTKSKQGKETINQIRRTRLKLMNFLDRSQTTSTDSPISHQPIQEKHLEPNKIICPRLIKSEADADEKLNRTAIQHLTQIIKWVRYHKDASSSDQENLKLLLNNFRVIIKPNTTQQESLSLPELLTRIVKNKTVQEASSSQGVIKNTLNLVIALYFEIPHIENMNNLIKKSNYYQGFYKDNNHQGSPGIVAYLGKDLQEFVFYLRQKGNSNLAKDEITIDL